MSEQKPDPYEVLGVARDADARTVKAAYFALVRKFPPETHPEDFQRLRGAYEVLSDPERREALDAARDAYSDLGSEQAALLRAANAAFSQGDEQGGETLLRRAIADYPELLAARELLGFAQLRQKAWGPAVGSWTDLVAREPDNARYHLHLGYARHGMEQHDAAVVSYRKALELGAGDPALAALADALADQKDWKGALAVLDERITGAGAKAPPPLVRRKVALLLLHGSARKAWRAFDDLAKAVASEPGERAAHADELASLAAWLFAKGEQKKANELLRRLAAIDPERKPDRLFPERSTVAMKDLPPASVDWLAGRAERPRRIVFREGGRALGASVALVPGALATWAAVWRCTGQLAWDTDGIVFTGVLVVAATLLLAFGGRRFHAALTAALPNMRILHPVHYLEVEFDRVRVYPLVNLHDVKIVRHSTNGIYTHTAVHLPFGKKTRHVSYRAEAEASAFADALLQRRRRVLELLANGLLENEEGIDFVPSPVLAAGTRLRVAGPAKLAGAALAAAAILLAVAVGVNRRAADARAWAEARASGSPYVLRAYGGSHNGSEARVRAELDAWVEALDRGTSALPPGKERETALSIARALAAGAPLRIRIEVAMTALEPLPPPEQPALTLASLKKGKKGKLPMQLIPIQPIPDPGVAWRDAAPFVPRLASALQAAFDRALGPSAIRVETGPPQDGIALAVALAPRQAGTYRDPWGPAAAAVALEWGAALRVPGSAPREVRGRIPPAAELTVSTLWHDGRGPETVYRLAAEGQVDRAVSEIAAALGLRPALSREEVTP
jgi:tetratricopeptide (TPR) repeat protein